MTTTQVMVVDDSLTVRKQLAQILTSAGFGVIEAVDGKDAFEQLTGGTRPALMILDANMPRMGGLELLEKMHETSIGGVSVVMLTTEGDARVMHRAKSLGAKGWIIKPFKSDLLLSAVKKLTAVV